MLQQIKVPNTIIGNSNESSWILKNLDDTIQFGESLVKSLPKTPILLLDGKLGTGKTSLVKGMAKGLNISETITSPTFSLAHHYLNGKRALIHLDLYRLEDHLAADELFLQEEETASALGGLMVIEWPSRLSMHIEDTYNIYLKYLSSGGRRIHLKSSSKDDKNSFTSS